MTLEPLHNYRTTRGAFRLKNVRQDILNSEYVPIPAVWTTPASNPDHGYITSGNTNKTTKIDHSAGDTTEQLPSSSWPDGNYKYSRGMSSSTAGYGAGGYLWGHSNVYKLTYATGAISTTGTMARPVFAGGQYSNNTHGYVIGGRVWYPGPYNPATDRTSETTKLTFASDTVADSPTAFTDTACRYSVGRGDQTTVYWKVSNGISLANGFRKTVYSTDTTSNLPATSTPAFSSTINYAGASDCQTKSYHSGGPGGSRSDTEKFTWASNTCASVPGGNLVQGKQQGPGADGASAGYTFGGYYDPGYSKLSIMQKLDFSAETWSLPTTTFSYSSFGHFAFNPNDAKNAGTGSPNRWIDGAEGANSVEFDGSGDYLSYADTSPFLLRNWWDQAWTVEYWMKADAFGQSANGGSNVLGCTTLSNTGEAWSFGPEENGEVQWYYWNGSIQTVASGKTLSTGQWYHLAFVFDGSTGMKIFVDGTLEKSATVTGSPTGSSSTFSIGRITSSGNDFNGIVSNVRITHAEVYSSNFTPSGPLTEITGTKFLCCQSSTVTLAPITYNGTTRQTNTTITSAGDPTAVTPHITGVVAPPAATPTGTSGSWQYQLNPGVPNHGYYLGGSGSDDTGSTNSMKFSFATDTFDNSVRLTNQFTTSAGGKMASSPSHAYCVYGQGNPAPGGDTGVSWCRKIQYSNDTGTNAPNAVDQPSHKAAIAGSMTNMYVAGGQDSHGVPLATRTNIRKLTYSNDTWTTISQSNANYSEPSGWPRANFASGGTQTYALWGWGSPNNYRTSISKYTYASDTGVFAIPGVTADYSQGSGQVGNSNSTHWWLARGNTSNGGPFQSKISRWTFATDTPQFPTTLTDEWYDYSDANGTGAINDGMTAGYWCGGHQDQSDSTSTLKISYATETASRGTDIPAGRTPGANGAFNGYAGTSVREFGAETTTTPNLI